MLFFFRFPFHLVFRRRVLLLRGSCGPAVCVCHASDLRQVGFDSGRVLWTCALPCMCECVVRHVGTCRQEVSYRATAAVNFGVALSRSGWIGCLDVRCERGLGLKYLGASTGKGVASSVPILRGVRRPGVGWTSSGEDEHFSPLEMCRE